MLETETSSLPREGRTAKWWTLGNVGFLIGLAVVGVLADAVFELPSSPSARAVLPSASRATAAPREAAPARYDGTPGSTIVGTYDATPKSTTVKTAAGGKPIVNLVNPGYEDHYGTLVG